MEIHTRIPFEIDKNLGRGYNDAMALVGNDDWVCFRDYDTLPLTHDFTNLLYEYVDRNPDAGILTCYTNRIHRLASAQLYGATVDENLNFKYHHEIALHLKTLNAYTVTDITTKPFSGFLMLISRRSWEKTRFNQDGKCLGVDTDYRLRVIDDGKKILRMNAIYIWHTYRAFTDLHDTKHLQ